MTDSQIEPFVPYTVIPEPLLEFGLAKRGEPQAADPQKGLACFGPYSSRLGGRWHPKSVRLIPIADKSDFDIVAETLQRLNSFQRIGKPSPYAREDYPGFESIFNCSLEVSADVDKQAIPSEVFATALSLPSAAEGYKTVVQACIRAMESLGQLAENEIVAVYLPTAIVKKFRQFRPDFRPIEPRKAKRKDDPNQMLLFEELAERERDEEETLYHDLRRSLKAAAMRKKVAIQVLTDNFLLDDDSQPWAGKFWNTATSVFCKAGGLPWRVPTAENLAHCGIRFGITKGTSGQSILVGLAQVFNARGELVALRAGQALRSKATTERGYYLSREQARDLMLGALQDYERITGRVPDRVIVHKSSPFKQDEADGIEEACTGVPAIDMIHVKTSTNIRLLPARGQPADRGTVFPSSEDSAIVYCTGFIAAEGTWRGKHVPRPMEIVRYRSDRSLLDHARELIRLTKMNWNTTIFSTREPCTFTNATEIIGMMKELGTNDRLEPHIRYYI